MKILVSEDDLLTIKALEYRLSLEGYTVLPAKDGKEAKDILIREKPDLFITDIHMPFHSGLELIRYVRNELKLTIPIIVLSRVGLDETRKHAFELGANDYISKPFNLDHLLSCIKKNLTTA